MNTANFTSSYRGYRIDVYSNDKKTFVAAIDDSLEINTKAESIAKSFKYATAIIERKIEKSIK